jgi:pimeloyl-ACP methyl ester carboxylesterase
MLRLLELTPEGRSELRTFQESVLGPAREAFAHGDINTGVTHFFDGIRGQPGAFASLSPLQQADLLKYGQELLLELTSDFDQYMPSISLEELHAVRVPTLLLSGGTSPRLFHLITGMLHPAIPGAGLVTISAADHSIHTSAPAVYNETVWEFIMTRF